VTPGREGDQLPAVTGWVGGGLLRLFVLYAEHHSESVPLLCIRTWLSLCVWARCLSLRACDEVTVHQLCTAPESI
jgi:hypothetical protein